MARAGLNKRAVELDDNIVATTTPYFFGHSGIGAVVVEQSLAREFNRRGSARIAVSAAANLRVEVVPAERAYEGLRLTYSRLFVPCAGAVSP